MIEKLDMSTSNFTDGNIFQIAKIFPNCVTETKDENGNIKKVIDFELLKQELSNNIVEGTKERYSLNWPGKKEALVTANEPIQKTLRPCKKESVNFDNTQNLYIEGDNLDALKLLQESYLNKVKMIYIDPPYNTGKDFIYKDNFTISKDEELENSGQIAKEGRLVANLESNGRYHSDWLSMMYPRLKLARNLLKNDGVIFISIDDNEVHNLRKICDEIFGEGNFVGEFIWKKKQGGGNDSNVLIVEHEYIIAYAKTIGNFTFQLDTNYELDNNLYPFKDDIGEYGLITLDKSSLGYLKSLDFEIKDNDGNSYFPRNKNGEKKFRWRWGKDKVEKDFDKLVFKNEKVYTKYYRSNGITPKSLLIDTIYGRTETGNDNIKEIFDNEKPFSYPKPLNLIEHFIMIGSTEDDLILDFFSGSATTAHAVMKLNSEDGGNRKFICVQLPETIDESSEAYKAGYKNICEIGKERIRRAGAKILKENKNKEGIENLDIGFRVFKIDSSNMKDVYYNPDLIDQSQIKSLIFNIKEDRTDLDLLFQVLLDGGVELTLPIEEKQIAGKKVYFVDGNILAACFEDNLTEEFVTKLAKCEYLLKVVFRDSSFGSDDSRINVEQIFKQYSPKTQIRVI